MDYKEKVIALLNSKELSQEQKEKLEDIFPELSESEDEKIRKAILGLVRQSSEILGKKNQNNMISWLEKQGEQPTDKIEPKFKIGNWLVHNNANIYQVVKIREDNRYELHGQRGEIMSVPTNFTYGLRLWTIQYANDGDVLLEEETGEPFIYNGNRATYFSGYFLGAYCGIYNGEFNPYGNTRHWGKNSCPATKEQRDLLFEKMEQAGYEWDAEKKELSLRHLTPTR